MAAAGQPGGPRLLSFAANAPGLPPLVPLEHFNTTRLLPAKYSDSVLTRVADSDEDLQAIFELESATNDRLQAEANLRLGISARELVFGVPQARIINAAFTHPHPLGGRFSLPFRGAWYAAFELPTAKAEVLFHRALHFAEIGWQTPEPLDYDQYLADFSGEFHDLRGRDFVPAGRGPARVTTLELRASAATPGEPPSFENCLDPASYVASQQLTLSLLQAGSLGVVYPSTRRRGGQCLACFRPALVANVRKRARLRLTWYPDRPAEWAPISPGA